MKTRYIEISNGSFNPSYWEVEFEDRMIWGRMTLCQATHITWVSALKKPTAWPSDVETPVPSIWVQKLSSIGTVSSWMGLCLSYLQGKSWSAVQATGDVSHREELSQCIALHPLCWVHLNDATEGKDSP
jgi:hypothetical protein